MTAVDSTLVDKQEPEFIKCLTSTFGGMFRIIQGCLPGGKYLSVGLQREINRQKAIGFYRMAFEGDPARAVELYAGDFYIQHNPGVEDGKHGFIDYFERMHREFPGKSLNFVRAVAEGDLVALHTHQLWPGNEEYVTMDFFRFDEHGKIVEHWDAIQRIPERSLHENGMY